MTGRMDTGKDAERLARSYLEDQGLRWVASNYRTKRGEIDLIMRDGVLLVFIEVRYRRTADFGGACASVNSHKQRRLIAAAEHYLQQTTHPPACRFDILGIEGKADRPAIEWIRDAFQTQ